MALQFKEGTISDYDLILSVSQEAINSQLKKLYNYQINTDDENPEHAINHDWTIQVETKKDKNNPGQRIIDPEVGKVILDKLS
jgi:hypothetical protein